MMKRDKGIAGLTIMLSIVSMLFVIGLIVMIFAIMSSELQQSNYTPTTLALSNETLTSVTEAGKSFATSGYRDAVCTLTIVTNATNGAVINSGNYTQTNCNLKSSGTGYFNNTNWNVSYSVSYNADNTATLTINETSSTIASVTDWYDIFIVIGAMVVLIMMVVLIVISVRSVGLTDGSAGSNNVGTA